VCVCVCVCVYVCVLGFFSCVSIFYAPLVLITQPEGHRVDECERISSMHVQHINCRVCGSYCGSMG
jgi:uncharacterized membrane protein